MQENRERRRDSKCNDNAGNLLHRAKRKFTGDDTGIVVGIWVSLLVSPVLR
jgi:hypothetical protein